MGQAVTGEKRIGLIESK